MRTNGLSFNHAKKIPITHCLSNLGFEPAKIRGVDYWYHSPFGKIGLHHLKSTQNLMFGLTMEPAKLEQSWIWLPGWLGALHEFIENLSLEKLDPVSLQQ